jgi:hypothetical protein
MNVHRVVVIAMLTGAVGLAGLLPSPRWLK